MAHISFSSFLSWDRKFFEPVDGAAYVVHPKMVQPGTAYTGAIKGGTSISSAILFFLFVMGS
jgi:hypothetical protein